MLPVPAGSFSRGEAKSTPAATFKVGRVHEGVLLGRGPAVELHDLAADPGETTDLAPNMPERATAMRARLDAWKAGVGAREMTARH